ncbi:MAG: TonB-dependent receptor [Lewinellaceae bacterium]|nr:TonB-dependent receptor [Saprospiraceae bacterium]MCB9339355.1 TonB-dependent receptor [Lewinellaceae bacterium]
MRLYTLTILLFTLFSTAFAQQKATIAGHLLDAQTNEPLPYATVVLNTAADGQMVSGTLTDDAGKFIFEGVEKGSYQVQCSFIGYTLATLPVLVGEKNNIFDLGKIKLETETAQLNEVVVEAKRAVVASGLDKKTFDIEDNFAQSVGSVLDAMKALPGIAVDQEGKVELRGSDKVAILIDGKQSSLTGFGNQKGLANIPAANIERIEIINNPSAKYDASGMAGIINIIYKKEKKSGWNGDVGLRLGLGQLAKRKADLPTDLGSFSLNPKYIPSLNLNYRNDKIHAFLQGEVLRQERLPNNEFNTRFYDDGRIIASQVPENRKQTQFIIKGGIDYTLDERNTISVSGIFDRERHVDTAQVAYVDLLSDARNRYWHWREEEITGYMNYRADYRHAFDGPGHELKFSAQYTRGWEDEEYKLIDSSIVRQSFDTTHLVAIEHTTTLLLDYVKPLRSGRLEGGAKLQIRRIPITYTIGQGAESVIYPGLGDRSKWGESIYAGYLNYVWEKEKFDLEAGLRAEQTDVFYNLSPDNIYYDQNDAYDYFKLYPNVRFSYKINERNSFSAFYNRRVDRPGEPELRIFAKYDDPELLKVGNPYLRPQFTQTFELAYKNAWESGSAFISGYHRIIDSPFLRIYDIDQSAAGYDIINRIYENVGSATNTGVELLLSQTITPFWKANGSFNWYVNSIDAFSGTLLFPTVRPFQIQASEDNTWSLKINSLLTLPKQTQIQLSFIYDAPKNIPQGRQFARSSLDVGIKKTVFAGKGEVMLAATDLLNRYGLKQEITNEGFDVVYENFYETQVVTLGVSYKF